MYSFKNNLKYEKKNKICENLLTFISVTVLVNIFKVQEILYIYHIVHSNLKKHFQKITNTSLRSQYFIYLLLTDARYINQEF